MSTTATGNNRDLNIFWFVQILSTAGGAFSLVAIPLLVLHVTGSVAQMGLVTGLAGVASIVTGVFADPSVRRSSRPRPPATAYVRYSSPQASPTP